MQPTPHTRKKSIKYYGVRAGRDGPRVYDDKSEYERAVIGHPHAIHKVFKIRAEAEEWVFGSRSLEINGRADSGEPGESNLRPEPEYFECEDGATDSYEDSDDAFTASNATIPSSIDALLPPATVSSCARTMSRQISNPDAHNDILRKQPKTRIRLSPEQQAVFDRVIRGENVFFTGAAGTGKSILLREIITHFRRYHLYDPDAIAVTASTGIASVNIKGTSLHSFAGIGLGKDTTSKMIEKVKRNSFARNRWHDVKRLIIDEVSMIDGGLFDKLEEVARSVRRINEPFGGLQLILSGDFCQLPPVPDRYDGVVLPATFCFDAKSWSRCVSHPIVLTQVFRQRDKKFVSLLNNMRFGDLTDDTVKEIEKLQRPVSYDDGIEPTELYPLRAEVETANKQRLERLAEPSHIYVAHDRPGTDARNNPITEQVMRHLVERLVVPRALELRVGAQVMLVKNLEQGQLVNGSIGKVVDFRSTHDALRMGTQIAFEDSKSRKEISKKLGIDLDQQPRPEGSIKTPSPSLVLPSESQLYSTERVWPVVKFKNERVVMCVPTEFTVESAVGVTEATRDQVPLILAWAWSVHKSQGQTLERVKVDLGRTFERGQAYVALSRAITMDHLEVINFDRAKVMAHPRVVQFYKDVLEESLKLEEQQILEDLGDEEMFKAFFEEGDELL